MSLQTSGPGCFVSSIIGTSIRPPKKQAALCRSRREAMANTNTHQQQQQQQAGGVCGAIMQEDPINNK